MSEEIKEITIKELFSSDNYVIPIYQRNYAWGELEITQLIQDIVDYIDKDTNYYIGTLIVWKRKQLNVDLYETIDGQQRLTTLSILLSLLRNEYTDDTDVYSWYKELKLKFDSRKDSTKTLESLFNKKNIVDDSCNIAIKQGYEIVKRTLKQILSQKESDKISIKDFCNYLFNKVFILRVLVPEDTDLNQYFEIMNSRGEQLEKHEILKAKMLEKLEECDRCAFNLIWEACSNMDRYVQYGFNTKQMDAIFGSNNENGNKWNELSDISKVYESLKTNNEKQNESPSNISIAGLLEPDVGQFCVNQANEKDSLERFNAVIDFPNFLLHILKIQIEKENVKKEEIQLDDKRLIDFFMPYLEEDTQNKKENIQEFVKNFGYNLLKGKFLFDKYIIKREFSRETDHWSLKRLKWFKEENAVNYINTFIETSNEDEEANKGINKDILMILAMFHVSMPTQVYKYWLNAALKFVFENSEKHDFSALKYKEYLENLADAFLFDRFLAKEPKNYFEIIYTNNGISKNTYMDEEKLDRGTAAVKILV
jgi:uncharacterized protein with ParB-like and HNH nuclease domain